MKGCLLSLFLLIITAVPGFTLSIKSEVFAHRGYMPDRYTCDGYNYSPPLEILKASSKTKSFVLVYEGIEPSSKPWTHWLLINIPADIKNIKENIAANELKDLGVVSGANDFGDISYSGPCPLRGKPRRYLLRLYALDKRLAVEEGVAKNEVLKKMQGHILAEAKLMGRYRRR